MYPARKGQRYEVAVFTAMRQVEIRVRDLAGFTGDDAYGVTVMTRAFKPDGGPLRDTGVPVAEPEVTMAVFRGAIGPFKNPTSHREVDFESPVFASEVVMLGDLLLRIVDRKRQATGRPRRMLLGSARACALCPAGAEGALTSSQRGESRR
jgi:uncharacterized protein (TIGR02391 family)